jgi:NADH:ubiquinone oxidoreductase subunit B-like Fe-S oxidoreductase
MNLITHLDFILTAGQKKKKNPSYIRRNYEEVDESRRWAIAQGNKANLQESLCPDDIPSQDGLL